MTLDTTAGVLVCQPVHQHAYEAAVAAQEAHLLRYFVTGLYDTGRGISSRRIRRWLPEPLGSRVEREVRRRWHPELSPERVLTIPHHELLSLTCRKILGRLPQPALANLETWAHRRFDAALGARLSSFHGVRVVHAFEGTAEATLRSATKLGMSTVLDVASAHEFLRAATAVKNTSSANTLRTRVRAERELADYLLAPSDYVVRCLLENDVPATKIIKLPYGVDVGRFRPVEQPVAEQRFRVLFVGRVGASKGVQYLLNAWRLLSLERAELVLVGPMDQTGRSILRGSTGRFRWIGSVPKQEVHTWFAASDVFVLPSLSDSWGLAVTEAMATGIPVVTTSACGAPVRHGIDGLVIPPGDDDALCAAIRFLHDHPEERRQMGAAGRNHVERHYTWQHYRQRLRLIYEALLQDRSPATIAVRGTG
jgi:glycosyltransferase involved in cell wall biosynthesis